MIPVSVREYLPDVEVDPRLVSGVLCGSAAALLALKWMRRRQTARKIKEAQKRREEGLQKMENAVLKFQQENGKINMDAISALSLTELAEKLQDGSITPERALYTYMAKALEVHKQVNCLTGFLPECEAQLREVKKQSEKGLLYGVPVSIKEHYGYKGHESNCGLALYLNIPEQNDSVIVQVLKKQGAVPFVKTNASQSMFNFECSNPIYGQTRHPLNPKKTTGGSTGGEGALIGGGGSILGFGSDIAGSIRVPSSFCGLCGIKPTAPRLRGKSTLQCNIRHADCVNNQGELFLSMIGIATPIHGLRSVEAMIGPMARDVDSLALCLRALLCEDMFHLDPTVPPLPFNEEMYSNSARLRIGYHDNDEYTLPTPCMRRAVQETKRLLEEAGHELIPFTPPRIDYMANELFTKGIFADGGSTLLDTFEGDIIDPNLKPQIVVYRLPRWVKKVLSVILRPLFPRIAKELNAVCGVGSAKELWAQHTAVEEYRQEFVDAWKTLKLDVMLCPAMGPALSIGYLGKLFDCSTITHLFNVLNFPAGVVPVTTVTKDDEDALKHYKGNYGDHWDKLLKKAATGGVGLPVAVQCAALPWQEEMCLRLMKEVEQLTKEKKQRS